MDVFVFVSDEDFRKSLESDYEEMEKCIEHGANKAVLVLAGSIIEAILCDYLIEIRYGDLSENNILQMGLGNLIRTCKEENIISEKAYDLSSVIKNYRNIIHPGRLKRLKESVDEHDSNVAKSLVNIIMKDISEKRLETYGPTAEQVISKLENDPCNFDIINHLVESAKEEELRRLLLKLIPDRYFEFIRMADGFLKEIEDILSALGKCFEFSFEKSSEKTKREVMNNFISILKTSDTGTINIYIEKFIRCQYFEYLTPSDLNIAKNQVIAKIERNIGTFDLKSLEGIGKLLNINDIPRFLNPFIQVFIGNKKEYLRGSNAENFLNLEYISMEKEIQDELKKQFDSWIDQHVKNKNKKLFEKLSLIRSFLGIPY